VNLNARTRRLLGIGLVAIAVVVILFDNWNFSEIGSYTTLAGIETRFFAYGLSLVGVGILTSGLVNLRR
jgi:hypothetical protein